MTEAEALLQPTNKICTAIYTIYLRPEFTTQGNEIGMLQPHGKNTSGYGAYYNATSGTWADIANLNTIGADYTNYPYPLNVSKQSAAKAGFSVTALVDANGTPLGFKLDVMRMYFSVCVQIRNVQNRWVEIMVTFICSYHMSYIL
jgi:hypothetical protein